MKLKIKNVGALSGVHVIDLTSGISVLVGPNGCGKSTIVGALFFVVTGESLTKNNMDDLISWGEDEATIELSSSDYTITRTITRGKGSKSSFTRGSATLTRREEIDEAVMSMFSICDKTAFRQVYFAEQFKAIEILDGTNSKRLEMLSALLGFGRFEKFREALRTIAGMIFKSRVDDEFMRVLLEQKASSMARCSDLTTSIEDVSKCILPPAEFSAVQTLAEATSEEDLTTVMVSLESKRSELQSVDEALSELDYTPPTVEESRAYTGALSYRTLKADFDRVESVIASIGVQQTPGSVQLRKIRDTALEKKMSLKAQVDKNRDRLNILSNGKCPITGGDPCSDLNKIVNPTAIENTVSELLASISDVDKDIAELDNVISIAEKYERDMAGATAERDRIKASMTAVEQYADFDVDAYVDKLNKSQALSSERYKLQSIKSGIMLDIAKLEAEEFNMLKHNVSPREQIEQAADAVTKHKEAVATANELGIRFKEAVNTRDNAIEALERAEIQNERASKGERATEFIESVRKALHKDNLPRLLVSTARSELNKKLANYLELFEFPYTVQWTAAGGIDYVNSFGDSLPASSLSGGQKYLLAVANRCAAADLIGSTFPLMVLDEPTTGLDDENRSKMAVMLQKVAQTLNGRGVSLVIPTHDDELLASANLIKVNEL